MMKYWKGFGRKWPWLNFKVLFRHLSGGTEENHKHLKQDSRSAGPLFETRTSRIRIRSVHSSTPKFGISRGVTSNSSSRALWHSYQHSSSIKARGTGKVSYQFCLTQYASHTSNGFWTWCKTYDMEPKDLLPLRRKTCYGFLSLSKSPSPLTIVPPRTGLIRQWQGC
jgi:hypothetical protein